MGEMDAARSIDGRAYAKLNLSLDVLGARPDGYHGMRMVMQSVTLCDDVRVALNDSGAVTAETNFGFLPLDGRNIAVRAAQAFFAAAGMEGCGAHIVLRKRIPVGAGLGGGSTDAAAVLRCLNELCGAGFSRAKLEEIGGTLGSDVPFCVAGGTQLAEERGDVLSPLPALPECRFVICKPRFSIRTPELFARIDSRVSRIHPDTDGISRALAEGDVAGVARRMYNVFEDVLPRRCGEIGVIKRRLLDAGALGAVMTGTGSAVFGVFPDDVAARAAAAALGAQYRECFTAGPAGLLTRF